MADPFGSRQVYANDDNSDVHLFEEGRQFATAPPGSGGPNWVTNAFTGWLLSPRGEYYPASCTQARTLVGRSHPYEGFVLKLIDDYPSLGGWMFGGGAAFVDFGMGVPVPIYRTLSPLSASPGGARF